MIYYIIIRRDIIIVFGIGNIARKKWDGELQLGAGWGVDSVMSNENKLLNIAKFILYIYTYTLTGTY